MTVYYWVTDAAIVVDTASPGMANVFTADNSLEQTSFSDLYREHKSVIELSSVKLQFLSLKFRI